MCIIAVKGDGVTMPNESIIKKMFRSNPDGAGFMVKRKRGKTVMVSKGHMTLEDFQKALKKAKIKDTDVVVMHFRIATVGGKSQNLTHPFVADPNPEVAEILEAKTNQLCIAHNGTIQSYRGVDKDRSDSSLFASLIMSSSAVADNLADEVIQELITDKLAGSRLAVIDPREHKIHVFGEWAKPDSSDYKWNKAKSGMIYSNFTWIPYTANVHSGYGGDYYGSGDAYARIGTGFAFGDDDEDDGYDVSIRDYSEENKGDDVYSPDEEADMIIADFEQLAHDYQDSFLRFVESTKAQFIKRVNGGMTMGEYAKLSVAWMNYLGIGDGASEEYKENEEKEVTKSNCKIGNIKTEEGWEDLPASDGKK